MRSIVFVLSVLPFFAFANNQEAICESLYDKAIMVCEEVMCTESLEIEGIEVTPANIKECIVTSDGDLMEGAQICALDGGEFENQISEYNKGRPQDKKVECEIF